MVVIIYIVLTKCQKSDVILIGVGHVMVNLIIVRFIPICLKNMVHIFGEAMIENIIVMIHIIAMIIKYFQFYFNL